MTRIERLLNKAVKDGLTAREMLELRHWTLRLDKLSYDFRLGSGLRNYKKALRTYKQIQKIAQGG